MSTDLDDAVVAPTTAPVANSINPIRVRPRPSRSTVVTWLVIAGLGAAAAVLVASGLRPDARSTDIDGVSTIARHGSISAIDHRDAETVAARHAPAQTIADHGSISAIDHRDAETVAARRAPAQTIADHGTISAIDHRDASAEPS